LVAEAVLRAGTGLRADAGLRKGSVLRVGAGLRARLLASRGQHATLRVDL
jgi:hypothetical protein